MEGSFYLKSRIKSSQRVLLALLLGLMICPNLWAAQEAMVIAGQAIIYADEAMTAPIGLISKGKKIKVGEIPRNRAQVYPIVVSGKIAYIKLADITTQKEDFEGGQMVSERFQNQTRGTSIETLGSVSLFSYNSQILIKATNGGVDDKDAVNWTGLSLRGIGVVNNRWELQLLANYMAAKAEEEEFRALEAGIGGGYRFLEWGRLTMRIEAHLLAVPWATYALEKLFRVKGTGYSTGAGLSFSLRLTKNWGVEGYGGAYYTALGGFSVPKPFASIEPVFFGTRMGAGIYRAF